VRGQRVAVASCRHPDWRPDHVDVAPLTSRSERPLLVRWRGSDLVGHLDGRYRHCGEPWRLGSRRFRAGCRVAGRLRRTLLVIWMRQPWSLRRSRLVARIATSRQAHHPGATGGGCEQRTTADGCKAYLEGRPPVDSPGNRGCSEDRLRGSEVLVEGAAVPPSESGFCSFLCPHPNTGCLSV
jgi:hypothetical protein